MTKKKNAHRIECIIWWAQQLWLSKKFPSNKTPQGSQKKYYLEDLTTKRNEHRIKCILEMCTDVIEPVRTWHVKFGHVRTCSNCPICPNCSNKFKQVRMLVIIRTTHHGWEPWYVDRSKRRQHFSGLWLVDWAKGKQYESGSWLIVVNA